MERFLRDLYSSSFHPFEMPSELRPAVMFRWCPLMCNIPARP
jgi:hypothetical protein